MVKRLEKSGWRVQQTTISRIEAGERAVRLSEAPTVAAAYGTTIYAMLGRPEVGPALEAARMDAVRHARALLERAMDDLLTPLEDA